jgi:hypothetical protein
MKLRKNKPIILAKQSEDAYLDPLAPIVLLPNGNIQCGTEIYKSDAKVKHQYPFVRDYLIKKRLPFDISGFKSKELIDVIENMQNKNIKSVSLKKLLEIVAYYNQVAKIKEYKVRLIKQIAYKRFWRRNKQLLDEKNRKASDELHKQLQERQRIVHEQINKF